MSFLATRASLLRRRPLVVGTLTGGVDLSAQLRRAASPFVDIVEVRLDTFPAIHRAGAETFAADLLRTVRRRTKKPVLLTLRSHTESGQSVSAAERLSDPARETLLRPLIPLVAMLDVEVRRGAFARRMSAVARRAGVDSIQSFHNFKSARINGLNRWVTRARAQGADVFKIAVTPKRDGELEAFLKWGMSLKMPRVLIGMGAASVVSRTVGFTFGSLLTYGHLGRSAAPGQMAAADLGRAVRRIYSGGSGRAK
jgi:3-dehydroquinate dehydratase-1